jgi:arginase family enzyme
MNKKIINIDNLDNITKTEEEVIEILLNENDDFKYFDTTVLALFSQGQEKNGVDNAPYLLVNKINEIFNITKNSIVIPKYFDNIDLKKDYEILYKYLQKTKSYVLIGGDYNCSQSSIKASLSKINPNDLYVIYIDSHPNINTMMTLITKKINKQPFSGIVQFDGFVQFDRFGFTEFTGFAGFTGSNKQLIESNNNLAFTNLLYFGIRNMSDDEIDIMTQHNIFYTMNLEIITSKIKSIIKLNPHCKFHVSFNVSALDPKFMKCTDCIKPHGLFPSEISNVINLVFTKMMAFDIVELNPNISSENIDMAVKSIYSILENTKLNNI